MERQLPAAPLEIGNRLAAFGWGDMLAIFTWLMARDGPHLSPPAWLQYGALALFWLTGLPGARYVLGLPTTRLRVGADGAAILTRRILLGRADEHFAPGTLRAVEVRESRDNDGDPYWRTLLLAADGRERVVLGGRAEAEQHALAARLHAALGLP